MADFYKLGFMKGIVILVKADEIYNILKCLLATRYWSRDKGGIGRPKFFLESVLQCPYVYYVPALLRGRLHLLNTIPIFS